ncbi:hypothetical protein [Photobacterium kishitanii]|uniref:Uncharacterized protein n=1 Tax=Photobacterium kishitanii TaxID=318456 RepID=A0A2T3KL83_9GAMM|nr:hypothetical protein [Photobacterium kishitanii]PSV00410.1 hypothetical protein C9J27_04580 [Photobacterium kishitanii]
MVKLPVLTNRMAYSPKEEPKAIIARIPVPNKVAKTKRFSFKKHGGVNGAIKEAEKWSQTSGRELWGDEWKPTGYIRERGGNQKGKSKPRKGKVYAPELNGVTHRVRVEKNGSCRYWWRAAWLENGTPRDTAFPYGVVSGKVIMPETARACAIFVRLSMEHRHMQPDQNTKI